MIGVAALGEGNTDMTAVVGSLLPSPRQTGYSRTAQLGLGEGQDIAAQTRPWYFALLLIVDLTGTKIFPRA